MLSSTKSLFPAYVQTTAPTAALVLTNPVTAQAVSVAPTVQTVSNETQKKRRLFKLNYKHRFFDTKSISNIVFIFKNSTSNVVFSTQKFHFNRRFFDTKSITKLRFSTQKFNRRFSICRLFTYIFFSFMSKCM